VVRLSPSRRWLAAKLPHAPLVHGRRFSYLPPFAAVLLQACVLVPGPDGPISQVWLASNLEQPAIAIVAGSGQSTASVLVLPAHSAPTFAGIFPVDPSPPFDEGAVRFYDSSCSSLGEAAFKNGDWLVVIDGSGPRAAPASGRDPVLPKLAPSGQSCNDFGPRSSWSVSLFSDLERRVLARLKLATKTLVLAPPNGTASVLYVAPKPEPALLEILDPDTCAILASDPLLDVSTYISIANGPDQQSIVIDETVLLDPNSEPAKADAESAGKCS
jgi:hypothetical protein